jgi:hypothetical protein
MMIAKGEEGRHENTVELREACMGMILRRYARTAGHSPLV